MDQKQALSIANNHIYIYPKSEGYVVVSPWRDDYPEGSKSEYHTRTYKEAAKASNIRKAELALEIWLKRNNIQISFEDRIMCSFKIKDTQDYYYNCVPAKDLLSSCCKYVKNLVKNQNAI